MQEVKFIFWSVLVFCITVMYCNTERHYHERLMMTESKDGEGK